MSSEWLVFKELLVATGYLYSLLIIHYSSCCIELPDVQGSDTTDA